MLILHTLSFNSNVVRLKGQAAAFRLRLTAFQFQCGAIKRSISLPTSRFLPRFNSNVVRLKVTGLLPESESEN